MKNIMKEIRETALFVTYFISLMLTMPLVVLPIMAALYHTTVMTVVLEIGYQNTVAIFLIFGLFWAMMLDLFVEDIIENHTHMAHIRRVMKECHREKDIVLTDIRYNIMENKRKGLDVSELTYEFYHTYPRYDR